MTMPKLMVVTRADLQAVPNNVVSLSLEDSSWLVDADVADLAARCTALRRLEIFGTAENITADGIEHVSRLANLTELRMDLRGACILVGDDGLLIDLQPLTHLTHLLTLDVCIDVPNTIEMDDGYTYDLRDLLAQDLRGHLPAANIDLH
jgi:hypothetical protein